MSHGPSRPTSPPDEAAVRRQLQRILAHESFVSAPVLQAFLAYIVEHGLRQPDVPLKESSLGVDVFARGQGFDPAVDTIVRAHARRLRKRLDDYYAGPGHDDPVVITMPRGQYVAGFAWRQA